MTIRCSREVDPDGQRSGNTIIRFFSCNVQERVCLCLSQHDDFLSSVGRRVSPAKKRFDSPIAPGAVRRRLRQSCSRLRAHDQQRRLRQHVIPQSYYRQCQTPTSPHVECPQETFPSHPLEYLDGSCSACPPAWNVEEDQDVKPLP